MSLSSTHRNNDPSDRARYLSGVPLNEITYGSFKDQITFVYSNEQNTAYAGRLDLHGTKDDLDWLCDALADWNISIKGNYKRFPQGDR